MTEKGKMVNNTNTADLAKKITKRQQFKQQITDEIEKLILSKPLMDHITFENALKEVCKNNQTIADYIGDDLNTYSNFKVRTIYDRMKKRQSDNYEVMSKEKALTFRRIDPQFKKLSPTERIVWSVKSKIKAYEKGNNGKIYIDCRGRKMIDVSSADFVGLVYGIVPGIGVNDWDTIKEAVKILRNDLTEEKLTQAGITIKQPEVVIGVLKA